MPKPLPPSRSWFDWVDEFEYLEWPDVWFVGSGVFLGFGLIMIWMAFDMPDQWDPLVSAGIGLVWIVVSIFACRLALLHKRNKG